MNAVAYKIIWFAQKTKELQYWNICFQFTLMSKLRMKPCRIFLFSIILRLILMRFLFWWKRKSENTQYKRKFISFFQTSFLKINPLLNFLTWKKSSFCSKINQIIIHMLQGLNISLKSMVRIFHISSKILQIRCKTAKE